MQMQRFSILLLAIFLIAGCSKEQVDGQSENGSTTTTTDGNAQMPKQDISDKTLTGIDGHISLYIDKLATAKNNYEAQGSDETKANLVNAYIAFGDYMTYESPVSPRKGKYRRALLEYRHALELDPDNEKVLTEIKQIEDIYASMGRPIPEDEL
jgi:tetratricopeptide (TPR) repeat protein